MDVSTTSLKYAEKRMANHSPNAMEFILIDENKEQLPLEDNSIDIIHSSGVLHHTPDISRILRDFHRILKDDGYCKIMVYNYNSIFMHLHVNWFAIYKYMYLFTDHLMRRSSNDKKELFRVLTDGVDCPISNCYTENEFIRICNEAGFEAEHVGNAINDGGEIKEFNKYAKEAISSGVLDNESLNFLNSLEINEEGIPCYKGYYAGIDSCYKLTKKAKE